MNRAKERIQYWLQIFLVPVYGLSFLMPRDKKLWLFGSTFGRRFAENPRYLFLYVSQHARGSKWYQDHPEAEGDDVLDGVRPVWISHNKEIVSFLNDNGYEAYDYHSGKGLWLALRGGVYIYDNYSKDINFWQSGGAVKVNLWHGSGNKQINHDNIHDKVRHPKNAWEKWKTWLRRLSDEKPTDYILSTSEAMKPVFASAFAVPLSHMIVDGYPRNDVLFDEKEHRIRNLLTPKEAQLLKLLEEQKKAGRTILAYMPTFRDSEKKFFDVMDVKAFGEFLEKENLLFVAKIHIKSKLRKEFEACNSDHIVIADPDIDAYTFFAKTDMLITDYSSVYTDYMLLDKPVIAFQYDREDYERDSRECTIDQDEYMPEVKAVNMQELMDAILLLKKEDPRKEKRLRSRERMFKYVDGCASKRLCEYIAGHFVLS
ncbi:MAG: CDP-glycerol glycerophosphotransferase family protein [Lachnospiraceae bacterium]|nr:CDP-glycerol glycerophosphotransferase family protein [Lachnospiraceae bacterium]